jgi:hypothetical protein
MGLSSKKTKTTSNQIATTTPNVPAYAQSAAQDYYSQVGKLGSNLLDNIDQYKTPANSLQQQATTSAQNLGGYQAGLNASTAQANAVGGAATPQASLPNAPALSVAQAAQLGNAQTVNLGGYNAAQAGPVTFDNPVAQANAASVLDNFDAYKSPATEGLVNATLANYDDQSGRAAAQMKAQGAKAGAFGGSRFGIAEAQFAADTGRNRALTEAQLQDQAFKNAAGLSQYDASNRQQTGLFNAGAQNDRTALGAQLTTQNNQFNTGQTNNASQFTADAKNTGSMFNANAQNDFTKTQAGFNQQANMTNAGAQNSLNSQVYGTQAQNSQFNAGMQGDQYQRALQAAGLSSTNAIAGGQLAQGDAATQASIGNSLWNQQQQNNLMPFQALGAQAGLMNPALIGQLSGQTVTASGTSTTKSAPSLFDIALKAATALA